MKNAMIEKKINDTEEKILDEYDLINSLSIGNYCRKIKHKFNTEELAVLVYRNKRMSIDEKISIYKNLIKNYPDMEVINCKHYDSVRKLISDEIKRLQDLKTNFLKQEENVVHFFNAYYESTRKWDNYIATKNNIVKTYKEIDELNSTRLKAISSLMKNKISLELFLDAYEEFKIEDRKYIGNWYTEEGLKLAGFSDGDIKKLKQKDENSVEE